jgi:AcrR family transcriptional regulator
MRPSKKDELVEKALSVFYAHGFHATGMDRLVAETGISKTSMYKHFRTKEELILATLRRRDEKFRAWFQGRVEASATEPRARLLALFTVLREWFDSADFQGCMFIKASGEFQDASHPIHALSSEHKQRLLAYVTGLAREAGASDPDGLARQLLILKEGAIVAQHMAVCDDPAGDAARAAGVLIDAALGGAATGPDRAPGELVFACPDSLWASRGAALVTAMRRADHSIRVRVDAGAAAPDVALVTAERGPDGRLWRRLADEVIGLFATRDSGAANDRAPTVAVDHGPDAAAWAAKTFGSAAAPPLTFANPGAALDHVIEHGGAVCLSEDMAEPYVQTGVLTAVPSVSAFRRPVVLIGRADGPAVRALFD